MTNLIYQGKINCQSRTSTGLLNVTWGGGLDYHNGSLSNIVTFFRSVKRIE